MMEKRDTTWDPYVLLSTDRRTAPLLKRTNGKVEGLFFTVDLPKGALVFGEWPYVEDSLSDTPSDERKRCHNDRWSWGVVESCLTQLTPRALTALLGCDYRTGIVQAHWEAGDAKAADYLTKKYEGLVERHEVCRLYDMMATNHIVSQKKAYNLCGAFNMDLPNGHAFYLLLAHMKHACLPTVYLEPPSEAGAPMEVRTLRAVAKGQPVTFDYLETVPLTLKRVALYEQQSFRCRCVRCAPLCGLLHCNKPFKADCTCRHISYCCKEHQIKDWPRHKTEHTTLHQKKGSPVGDGGPFF